MIFAFQASSGNIAYGRTIDAKGKTIVDIRWKLFNITAEDVKEVNEFVFKHMKTSGDIPVISILEKDEAKRQQIIRDLKKNK